MAIGYSVPGRYSSALWLALVLAFIAGTSSSRAEPTGQNSGDVQLSPPAQPPQLVFACDSATGPLQTLFADPAIIADLQKLHAGVALALADLSPGRAEVVRKLNQAGIPVTAWLALPMDQGYYMNAGNEPQTAARFAAFQKWTADNGLRWVAIGLDIEPDIRDFADMRHHKLRLLATLVARYFEIGRVQRAREAYAGLIRNLQASGYPVETYQFPFIADERDAHTTLLERLFGLVDVRGNTEVLMLYTSFNHTMDSAVVWKYGPQAQAIAVGSTKNDPASDAQFPPLNWSELSHDLLVASHFSHVVAIYSLEGCVQQGFLPKLMAMDWNQPVTIPAAAVAKVNRMRSRIHTILWIGTNLPYFALVIFIAIAWWISARRKHRLVAGGQG